MPIYLASLVVLAHSQNGHNPSKCHPHQNLNDPPNLSPLSEGAFSGTLVSNLVFYPQSNTSQSHTSIPSVALNLSNTSQSHTSIPSIAWNLTASQTVPSSSGIWWWSAHPPPWPAWPHCGQWVRGICQPWPGQGPGYGGSSWSRTLRPGKHHTAWLKSKDKFIKRRKLT